MYHQIMHPTDLYTENKKIAHKAYEIAKKFDAKFYLMHVVEPIPAYGYPGLTDVESPHIEHVKKQLAKLGEELDVPAEQQFLIVGNTKTEILNKSKALNVDLIIVGSHGRHGLARLLGSTANSVIHSAVCDVMTIRYEDD